MTKKVAATIHATDSWAAGSLVTSLVNSRWPLAITSHQNQMNGAEYKK